LVRLMNPLWLSTTRRSPLLGTRAASKVCSEGLIQMYISIVLVIRYGLERGLGSGTGAYTDGPWAYWAAHAE
jgi:hypothetical protein